MNQHLPKGVLGNSRDVKRKKRLQGFHGQRNLAKGLHEKTSKAFHFLKEPAEGPRGEARLQLSYTFS